MFTEKIIKMLQDYQELLDKTESQTEEYQIELSEIIDQAQEAGDNLLLTQKEAIDFYKQDCISLTEFAKNSGFGGEFLNGFMSAVELFSDRDEF